MEQLKYGCKLTVSTQILTQQSNPSPKETPERDVMRPLPLTNLGQHGDETKTALQTGQETMPLGLPPAFLVRGCFPLSRTASSLPPLGNTKAGTF